MGCAAESQLQAWRATVTDSFLDGPKNTPDQGIEPWSHGSTLPESLPLDQSDLEMVLFKLAASALYHL